MASFNLGRIKGDKGDSGAKGDMGPKGEKGDKGENGVTPVFSVKETKTISSSESAYVEITNDDPKNPALSFYIPRGKDGKETLGDMSSAVYDSEGKAQDIFKYADTLLEKSLKKSGGEMLGEISAYKSSLNKSCVRNISVLSSLPESGKDGDICILKKAENLKTIGECTVGTTVLIPEDNQKEEYIIVGKNNIAEGGITLIRKNLPSYQITFDYAMRNRYLLSDADILLETMYKYLFPESLRKKMLYALLENKEKRQCFLASLSDLENMEYFKENGKGAFVTSAIGPVEYLTRTIGSGKTIYTINKSGLSSTLSQNALCYFRPVIVLDSGCTVENIVHNNLPAVSFFEYEEGIFAFKNGAWEECASWRQ